MTNPDSLAQLAIDGYEQGTHSETDLMRMLGLPSRVDVHRWLAERQIPMRYTESDLASDLATLSRLGLR